MKPFPKSPTPRPWSITAGEMSARKHRQLCHMALRAAIEFNMREPSDERRQACSEALATYRKAVEAEERERELQEQVDDALEAAVSPPLPPPQPEPIQELGPVMPKRAAAVYAVIVAMLIVVGWTCSASSCHF